MTQYTTAQLEAMGGKAWNTRYYFNDLKALYGLQTWHYKTGNVQSAELDGEGISNGQATRLLTTLEFGKVWYDTVDGKFHGKGVDQDMLDKIVAAITAKVEQAS